MIELGKIDERKQWAEMHPTISNWLNRLADTTRSNYRRHSYEYFMWLQDPPEAWDKYRGVEPEELLELQDRTMGRERFEQVTLLQGWIQTLTLRQGSKQLAYSALRSWYAHNHVPLPRDVTFTIRGDKPPVKAELTTEELKQIVLSSNDAYQGVFLMMFQGFMGCTEFEYVNTHGWSEIQSQLEDGKRRIRVTLPGRKHSKNRAPYYTFFGKDAVDALKKYLETQRGSIRKGEPIFIGKRGNAIDRGSLERYFCRHGFKVDVISRWTPDCPECGATTRWTRPWVGGTQPVIYVCNKCGRETPASDVDVPKDIRYKIGPHEMRDLARSEWDLSPAKGVCAEFFMGHDIDPNDYNKIMKLHPDWAEKQYGLAEPFLNIMSEEPRKVSIDRVAEMQQELERAKTEVAQLRSRLNGQKDLYERVEALEEFIKKKMKEN